LQETKTKKKQKVSTPPKSTPKKNPTPPYLFKQLFGLWTFVLVRVVLQRQFTVGFLDHFVRRRRFHPQHLVMGRFRLFGGNTVASSTVAVRAMTGVAPGTGTTSAIPCLLLPPFLLLFGLSTLLTTPLVPFLLSLFPFPFSFGAFVLHFSFFPFVFHFFVVRLLPFLFVVRFLLFLGLCRTLLF
jgi:hypothetical protein